MNKKTPKPQYQIRVKLLKEFEDTTRDILIVILKSRGASLTEIGKVFDLNKSTVSRIIKNNKKLLEKLK